MLSVHMASKWKRWASCLFSRSSAFCNTNNQEFATGSVTTIPTAGPRIRVSHDNLATRRSRMQTQYNDIWFIVRGPDRHKERDTDRELITDTMAHFTTPKYLCVRSQIEPTPDTCCPRLIITHTANPGEWTCVCVRVCSDYPVSVTAKTVSIRS